MSRSRPTRPRHRQSAETCSRRHDCRVHYNPTVSLRCLEYQARQRWSWDEGTVLYTRCEDLLSTFPGLLNPTVGIVQQEMLHLSLVGNIARALDYEFKIYNKDAMAVFDGSCEMLYDKVQLNLEPAKKHLLGTFVKASRGSFVLFRFVSWLIVSRCTSTDRSAIHTSRERHCIAAVLRRR